MSSLLLVLLGPLLLAKSARLSNLLSSSSAVTISLATFRGFPWRKVPFYVLAQILGACFGSCLIQGNYHALLNQYEGGYNLRTFGLPTSTATLFFTGPQPYMSNM